MRVRCALLSSGLICCCMTPVVHAITPSLTGTAFGRYGSGNTTHGEYSLTAKPLANQDSTNIQSLDAPPADGPIHIASIASSNIAVGALGAAARIDATSNSPTNTIVWFEASGAYADFADTLTLSSPTLPAGTPVVVTFKLQVAWVADLQHSVPAPGGSNNFVSYGLSVSGGINSSTYANVSPPTSKYLDGNDNKLFYSTEDDRSIAVGIFDNPDHHLDVPITSHVGDTITIGFSAHVNLAGSVAVRFPGGVATNSHGEVCGSVGLAVGASAGDSSVVLTSAKLGGAYPAASVGNAANAAAIVPIASNNCSTAAVPVCGNNTKEAGEQCDDGNTTSGDGCSSVCLTEPAAACGNGVKETGEGCDDGNTTSGDGCSATCQVEGGQAAVCGNGAIEAGEECDDGNTTGNDGCSASCTIESGFVCSGTPSSCHTVCGDGIKATSEECEDGNTVSGDGCSSICQLEGGAQPACGNGVVEGSETCDDGNLTNNDGCSASCAIEAGFICSGAPSSCQTVCGDGIISGSEACDDGNTTNGDGCSATCQVEQVQPTPHKPKPLCAAGVGPVIPLMLLTLWCARRRKP